MRRRGYTLVELMTVLAIIGVLTGMTAGALGPMVRRLRVSQATSIVVGALDLARTQALASLRCTEVDVTNPSAGHPTALLAPVAPGAAGTLVRVWRWNDLTCAGGHAAAVLQQSYSLPAQVGAALPAPVVFGGNGRLPVAARVEVDALGGSPSGDTVVVTLPGVICSFARSDVGACP